jgi:putative transposase
MICSQEFPMSDPVLQFLDETRDTREYKRALAVNMAHQGIAYETITTVLQVSKSFISKWKGIYAEQGIDGFRIGYRGSVGYLTAEQRAQTIAWLREQNTWSVPALQAYLRDTFQVEYQSLQSYYDLMHEAGLSWKKSQATNPKKRCPGRRTSKGNNRVYTRPSRGDCAGRAGGAVCR